MLQVIVDADNLAPRRLQPVLDLIGTLDPADGAVVIAGGRAEALARLDWPDGTRLLEHAGWQRADVALAEAYRPDGDPLVLATGDGDFGLLAARHGGPVLVVSGAASNRLRDHAVVVDPAVEGTAPIRNWLRAVGATASAD